MKKIQLLLAACVTGAMPLVSAAAQIITVPPATSAPTAASTQAGPATPIDAIRQAPDPSSAIAAYAAAGNGDPVAAETAYVRRMVELGVPEMADSQAIDLLKRGSNDAIAHGVVAYGAAARGQIGLAAAELKKSVSQAPDEPFLIRTSAQLVGWYDSQLDRTGLTKDDTQNIEWLRTAEHSRPEFDDAYRVAMASHRAASPATAQSDATVTPSTSPPQTIYYNNFYTTPTYYPSDWWTRSTWWPYGSFVIIRDCDFRNRIHHPDGIRDGLGDGRRDGFLPLDRFGNHPADGHTLFHVTPAPRAQTFGEPGGPRRTAEVRPAPVAPTPAARPSPPPSPSFGGGPLGGGTSRGSSSGGFGGNNHR